MERPQRDQTQSKQQLHVQTVIPAPAGSQFQQQQQQAEQQRTASSTPLSSPGLVSTTTSRAVMSAAQNASSEAPTPAPGPNSPYLHPLQHHKVRETHKALVDLDYVTGRKIINQYEVIEEIGRGVHGKVKLARNLETQENVAIKIIPRFSKKRRLGKVTARSPEEKTKREIAILKKIRHPNIVALLEIIDDKELKKIYLVLEHVELGEVVWRKKGIPFVCAHERRRQEREMAGLTPSFEEQQYENLIEQRAATKAAKQAKQSQAQPHADYWSNEYGGGADDEVDWESRFERGNLDWAGPSTVEGSRATSRVPSRGHSVRSMSRAVTPQPSEPGDVSSLDVALDNLDIAVGTLRSNPASMTALDGTMYGAYDDVSHSRRRSPSMADSIISHMSSVDGNAVVHDSFTDDFSYVPCFTLDLARVAFRDTVLGLEYLHYQGVVHRDIKPANLLSTRDRRVKISDFGVSYFGRPIREGELGETVSESEARDFDDDLELAKTVGTPAFFAPELCWTDYENMDQQPKITEQIDVWSLGVTLFCIIFARIPFMADDEFQMFRNICHDEIYIPSTRLAPVDPSTSPSTQSLYARGSNGPYRADSTLEYEEIEPALRDLLYRMLEKDPEKRIRLRDVKRHAWVVRGISDLPRWLEETDPARSASGKRIQVDESEMSDAIIPLGLFKRARSAVRKAVVKVLPRLERTDSGTRRRAGSSVASSGAGGAGGGDGSGQSSALPSNNPSIPQFFREGRRRSLRGGVGEDYFHSLADLGEQHPLSQSVTASPQDSPSEDMNSMFPDRDPYAGGGGYRHSGRRSLEGYGGNYAARQDHASPSFLPQTPTLASPTPLKSPPPRHLHTRSVTDAFLPLTSSTYDNYHNNHSHNHPHESRTVPATPAVGPLNHSESDEVVQRGARDANRHSMTSALLDDASRSRSVDRGLFASSDKHSEAVVSISRAVAPGNVSTPRRRPLKSIDLGRVTMPESGSSSALSSPLILSPRVHAAYQHGQPNSDPNMHDNHRQHVVELEERPQTAHRVEDLAAAEGRVPSNRFSAMATAESLARAQEFVKRRQQRELEEAQRLQRQQAMPRHPSSSSFGPEPAAPPSPSEDNFPPPPSRGETMVTANSTSTTSMAGMTTPLTSPSEVTSPVSMANLGAAAKTSASDRSMLVFQSDPSLPALMSGASSVSADLEGDFLGRPGVTVGGARGGAQQHTTSSAAVVLATSSASAMGASDAGDDAPESLTPPALVGKDAVAAYPMDPADLDGAGCAIRVKLDVEKGTCNNNNNNNNNNSPMPRGRQQQHYQPHPLTSPKAPAFNKSRSVDDDCDDSDSDEGLTMAKSKRKSLLRDSVPPSPMAATPQTPVGGAAASSALHANRRALASRRRDTNTSIASTETAKKISMYNPEEVSP